MPIRPIVEEEEEEESPEVEEDSGGEEALDDHVDVEFDDRIPCTWRYVANCYLLPLTNGGVNGFPWSGVALFFQLNGWPLWKLGVCSFAGFGLRVIMAILYLKLGTWLSLVSTSIHLACCVPALINPFAEWAVIIEMIALLGLDSMLPNDAIVFYNYCDSEAQAQRAATQVRSGVVFKLAMLAFTQRGDRSMSSTIEHVARQVLQSLVACYATASTLGGVVYDLAGWRGCAGYHLSLQILQAVLIFTEPAVWASWSEWRHRTSVSDGDMPECDVTTSIVPVVEDRIAEAEGPSGNPPSLLCDDLLPSPSPSAEKIAAGSGSTELQGTLKPPEHGSTQANERKSSKPTKESVANVANSHPLSLLCDDLLPSPSPSADKIAAGSSSAELRGTLRPPEHGSTQATERKSSKPTKESVANGANSHPLSPLCDDLLPSPSPSAERIAAGSSSTELRGTLKPPEHANERKSSKPKKKSAANVANSRVSFAAVADTRGSMFFARGSFFGGRGSVASEKRLSHGASNNSNTVSKAVPRRTLMSRFPDIPRSSVAVQMSRRSMACGNMIPMATSREASQLMFFDQEEEEEPGVGAVAGRKAKKTIPYDIMLPAVLICLIGFNHNLSYQSEWTLYAVFFAEQHGWQSATWAGLAQTSGDVLGTMIMHFQSRWAVGTEEDGFAGSPCQWLWYSLTAKPYTASWILLFWVILNLALTAPSLPAAVAAQVVMGTVFVLSMQTATKMNLFFSLGDGDVFLALQVLRQNFESFGSALAALVSLLLYERVHPLAPFWLTAGVSLLILLFYTLAFCKRVGFGQSLDTAEEARSQRKGLTREKTWQKSNATMAATKQLSMAWDE